MSEGGCINSEIVFRRLMYEIDIIISNCEKRATHIDNSLQIFRIRDFFLEAGYNVDLTQMKWLICEGWCWESKKITPGILTLQLPDVLHHSVVDYIVSNHGLGISSSTSSISTPSTCRSTSITSAPQRNVHRTLGASGLGLFFEVLCHSRERQAAIACGLRTHVQRGICGPHSIRGSA